MWTATHGVMNSMAVSRHDTEKITLSHYMAWLCSGTKTRGVACMANLYTPLVL